MRLRTSSDWEKTSYPATRAVPPVAGMKQARIRIVVVFPAPLGPRKPTTPPFSMLKETSRMAVTGPYCLVSRSTWIIPRSGFYHRTYHGWGGGGGGVFGGGRGGGGG